MTHKLNEHLYNAYGFADKRYSRVEFGRAIATDLHNYGKFNDTIHCRIFVRVYDGDVIELLFHGNRPTNAEIERLQAPLLRSVLRRETPDELRALAAAYRRARVPQDEKSWAFSRKEVAADLEQLAKCLERFIFSNPRFASTVETDPQSE